MAAFHCRRAGRRGKQRHLLITGTYAPDRLKSMQRYSDLVQAAITPTFAGVVERLEPPIVFGGQRWMPERVRKQLGYFDKYVLFPMRLRLHATFQAWRGMETLIHVTDQGLGPLIPWMNGFRVIVTVHDLIAVRAAIGDIPGIPRAGWWRGGFQRFIFWSLRFPSTIVCVSEKTHRDCERLVGPDHHFHVVLNPLDPEFDAQAGAVVTPVLPKSFLLHVGNGLWYKNRKGVLLIYAALRGVSKRDVLNEFGGANFSQFKNALVDVAEAKLGPIGAEMKRIQSDPAYIDEILRKGSDRARLIAAVNMAAIKDIIGFIR